MTQITPCVIHSSVVRQMKDNCEKQMTPVFGTQTSLPDLSNSVTVFSVPTHTLTPPHKSTKEGRKHLNMNLTCLYIHIFHIYMYIISTYFTKHTPPWSDRQCTEPSSRLPQERWKQPPMKGFSGVIWAIHILRRMHWMTTSYFPLQVADPVATMPRPTTATASRVVCRNEFKWVQSASTFWRTAWVLENCCKFYRIYVWWNTFLFRSKWIPNNPTIRLSNSNPSVTRHQPLHKHAHHSFLLVEPSLLHLRTCH